MGKYITLIEDKDDLTNLQSELSEQIMELQKKYYDHVLNTKIPIRRLRKEKEVIIDKINYYKMNENKIKSITNDITELGKRINKYNINEKKVKFLIPNTKLFIEYKNMYIDDSMMLMC